MTHRVTSWETQKKVQVGKNVMDGTPVSPQNSQVEALTPSVAVLGEGTQLL